MKKLQILLAFLLLCVGVIVYSGCARPKKKASEENPKYSEMADVRVQQLRKKIHEENPKYSETAAIRVQQLRKKIHEELSNLEADHWAGRYYFGDGLGVNVSLDIAPKTGFVFEWHGCLGLYDRNYGKVQEKDGEIHLAFELENKQEGFQGISPAFLPIRWGNRRYFHMFVCLCPIKVPYSS